MLSPRSKQLLMIAGSVASVVLIVGAVAILPTVLRDGQSSQDPSQQSTTAAPTLEPHDAVEVPDPTELDEAACERTHNSDGDGEPEADLDHYLDINSSGVAVGSDSQGDRKGDRPFRFADGEKTTLGVPDGTGEKTHAGHELIWNCG